jgi:N-acetylglutamate synthase-like GNAT family acetyltransferase
VAADFVAMFAALPPNRILALTAELDGKVVGIGGFRFTPDGVVAAFVHMTDEARGFPVAIHRAGLTMMRRARALGIRRIVALAEDGAARNEAWLARLGFRPVEHAGETVWVWESRNVE